MRSALAALAVACACLGVAGPAVADIRRAALGDLAARLTLTHRAFGVEDLRLTVSRAGTVVYDAPVTTASGRPGALQRTPPLRRFSGVHLQVLDLDGDGRGEAIVDLAERGSYCCSHTLIVGAGKDGAYHPLELDWGSYGSAATYVPLARGEALVARDARLEERYTPHVLSFVPVRIFSWSHGSVRDISHDQPRLVRRDLNDLQAERRRLVQRKDHEAIDFRGLLLAIAGDRMLLGLRGVAVHALGIDVAAGRARVRSGGGPIDRAYAIDVLAELARLGY